MDEIPGRVSRDRWFHLKVATKRLSRKAVTNSRFPHQKNMELSSRFSRFAPISLRLIVGFGFMQHGFAKLSRGPNAFATILQALGVPSPHFMAWLTILTELLGGFAMILGAFVTLISIPMAILMLVAIFTVHLPYGFSSIKLMAVTAAGPQFGPPGYEVSLLYLACLLALVVGGPGPLAVDSLSKKARNVGHSLSKTLP